MAAHNNSFAIDDQLNTPDNLARYAQVLQAMDASLGAALAPYLASLASGQRVDMVAIWDALYVATKPTPNLPSQSGE